MTEVAVFAGTLSRGAYARRAAIRLVAFVVATLAFAFILRVILIGTNCAGGGAEACGVVGLVASMYIKPVIYLAFVLSFIGITVRRVRDLGLPTLLAAIIPILLLGDAMFGITIRAPWSLGFMLGAGGQWPRYVFAALVCIAFLCAVPTPAGEERGRWGFAGAIALGVLVLMCIEALFKLTQDVSPWIGSGRILLSSEIFRMYARYGIPAMLVLLLSLVVWRQRLR